jgi:hypothetical protein
MLAREHGAVAPQCRRAGGRRRVDAEHAQHGRVNADMIRTGA